jgi:hypothetical protein
LAFSVLKNVNLTGDISAVSPGNTLPGSLIPSPKAIPSSLRGRRPWQSHSVIPLCDFEQLAIEEFKLAAIMDVLAAKRTLQAKGIKAGFSKKDMQKMAGQFKKTLARKKQTIKTKRQSEPVQITDNRIYDRNITHQTGLTDQDSISVFQVF